MTSQLLHVVRHPSPSRLAALAYYVWARLAVGAAVVADLQHRVVPGRGKRVPVIVTIDGSYTYKTTIGVMGGRYLVSFNAETRKQTGRAVGDEVEVELITDPDR